MTPKGINREHGAEDPKGTKTVAAPATVSGLLSILAAFTRRATAGHRGKANGKRVSASQETCRQVKKTKRTGCSDGYELAFAQQYMALLAQRFPGSFQLKICVEPEQQTNYQLVPCCLQLLLENAVKHNVASAAQPLVIKLELQQNLLIVHHPLRSKAFAQPGTGTGLTNLSERCLALLGMPIEIIQNDEFIVKVPLQHND